MRISDWSSDVCSSDLRASLNGTDDVQGAELGFPFPIPKSGAEPIWNHKLEFRGSAVRRYNNQAIVKPDGSYKISKLIEDVKFKRSEEHTSELQSLIRISYDVFCFTKTKYQKTLSFI